ncbi:MAG: TonB-dependent receptor plug domain-containing protein [Candidatus Omnitrophota bacterium]
MRTMPARFVLALAVFLNCPVGPAAAESDLTGMSLEELMDMEVYSASKKTERLFNSPSATYVISNDDIRRSGATNLPDLLRLVPGVNVQRLDSSTWDISIRGFNSSIFSNKVLVLIDGRSVYTTLYGGVFWDIQDVMLEDVDRIEVVRGPGGTVWGANAVNGVINIITKKAKDTQGGLITAGGGSEERGFTSMRYGWESDDWYYRAYSKYFNRDNGFSTRGNDIDEWSVSRGGFRADKDNITFQGDFYDGYARQWVTLTKFTQPYKRQEIERMKMQGGNLMFKYQDDELFWQVYWDATYRRSDTFNERRDMIDLEVNRLLYILENHEINVGAGYRLNTEALSGTPTLDVHDAGNPDQVFSLFIQDEIKWLEDRLTVILGSKFEHNIYTNFEFQPNVRVSYDLNDTNMVWAAASRAVRTPSRLETDGSINGHSSGVLFSNVIGSHDLDPEELKAYEIGYRTQPRENILLDFTAFYHDYDRLIVFIPGQLVAGPLGVSLFTLPQVNGAHGKSNGFEMAADVKLKKWWTVKGSYAFVKLHLQPDPNVNDFSLTRVIQNGVPHHTFSLRSSFDLPRQWEFDTVLRYVDAIKHGSIKPYTAMDVRISKSIKNWEIALVGQNLLEARHKETSAGFPTQVERSGYLKITFKF